MWDKDAAFTFQPVQAEVLTDYQLQLFSKTRSANWKKFQLNAVIGKLVKKIPDLFLFRIL